MHEAVFGHGAPHDSCDSAEDDDDEDDEDESEEDEEEEEEEEKEEEEDEEETPQRSVSVFAPHAHARGGSTTAHGGHGPGWHGMLHGCGHSSMLPLLLPLASPGEEEEEEEPRDLRQGSPHECGVKYGFSGGSAC